jgi:uncharacterized membrane protein
VNTTRGLFTATMAAVLCVTVASAVQRGLRRLEPQNICEAVETIEAMGLYWTTDAINFPTPINDFSTITIGTEPISIADAWVLATSMPAVRWAGKARVYSGKLPLGDWDDEVRFVHWGNLTLVGDRNLVDRIMQHK